MQQLEEIIYNWVHMTCRTLTIGKMVLENNLVASGNGGACGSLAARQYFHSFLMCTHIEHSQWAYVLATAVHSLYLLEFYTIGNNQHSDECNVQLRSN